MKLALDKYGINMPAFGKIGGILASELSDNDAALHAAIVAINEAIDRGESQGNYFFSMQDLEKFPYLLISF